MMEGGCATREVSRYKKRSERARSGLGGREYGGFMMAVHDTRLKKQGCATRRRPTRKIGLEIESKNEFCTPLLLISFHPPSIYFPSFPPL